MKVSLSGRSRRPHDPGKIVSPTSSAVGVVPLVFGSAAAAGGAPSLARTQRQTEPPECPGVCSTSISPADGPRGSTAPCSRGRTSAGSRLHCFATRPTYLERVTSGDLG